MNLRGRHFESDEGRHFYIDAVVGTSAQCVEPETGRCQSIPLDLLTRCIDAGAVREVTLPPCEYPCLVEP